MKQSKKLIQPTPEEDVAIAAGVAADPDTYILSDAEMSSLRPLMETNPQWVVTFQRQRGRPRSANPKQHVSLRLDPDVLAYYKSLGAGWLTTINDTLRHAMGAPHSKL